MKELTTFGLPDCDIFHEILTCSSVLFMLWLVHNIVDLASIKSLEVVIKNPRQGANISGIFF
jgi:hypothetical protein